ncbi:hypothetical protein [Maricaulis sp.]|uniref:hypothetical protein n=1 Tax=Maricaulis sp. TaxID=1486257 RepID=UPI0026160F9B|nr:hypothetical protein [Maricaulis sp.]
MRPGNSTTPYGWALRGLTVLIALYSAFWSGLLIWAWTGLAPTHLGSLDTAGTLEFVPVWARFSVWLWTLFLAAAVWACWTGRARAWLWVVLAMVPHLVVFLTLSANPFYDGTAGYINFAIEFGTALLLYFAARSRGD